MNGLCSRDPRRFFSRLEQLESRVLMAAAPPVLPPPPGLTLLNPATIPQFVNDITPGGSFFDTFKYTPNPGTSNVFSVGSYQITDTDLGLGPDPVSGAPRLTDLFGYGPDAANATYPGRSFEVVRGQPIAVTWTNGLPDGHVVNIDPTLLDGVKDGLPPLTYDPRSNSIVGGIPAVPHLHGGHTDAVYDGTPMQWWNRTTAGMDYVDTTLPGNNPTQPANTFTYRNDQDAGTLWYHDHAMGVTRLNAYAGMAGFYVIRDGNDTGATDNPLGLPADQYEVGLAIQDKQFLSDGSLWFPANAQPWPTGDGGTVDVASTLPEMFGDTILVNGKAWPKMNVEQRRYRFRLLNGSDSRFYTMTFGDPAVGTTPIWQIGTDDGLLNTPVKLGVLTLGPGERADVIVDFSKFKVGTRFVLTNTAQTPFPVGARVVPGITDRIMAFDVVARVGADNTVVPTRTTQLRPLNDQILAPADVPWTRQVALYETTDRYGRITPLLGTPETSKDFIDPNDPHEQITYDPVNGTTEVWQVFNNTPDAHPIHLHQTAFQILTRNTFSTKLRNLGVDPVTGVTHWGMGPVTFRNPPVVVGGNEVALKDTFQILPGEVITLRAHFDLPGKYVTHCHILAHEEHDMMRFMQVGNVAYPDPGTIVKSDGSVEVRPASAAGPVLASAPGSDTVFSAEAIAPATGEDEEVLSVADQVLV